MFGNIFNLFKKKSENEENKSTAKERLHLVLMQDRANVSADFLDLMKQEIIEVIKKYIEVDENQIDVKLTNKVNGDGTTGAPALYANIPIKSLKKETRINLNKELLKEQNESNGEINSTETAENGNDIEIIKIKNENDGEENIDESSKESLKNDENETTENIDEGETEKKEAEKSEKVETTNVEQKEKDTSDKTEEKAVNQSENGNNEENQKETENKNANNGNNKKKKKNRKNKKNEGTTFFENIKDNEHKTDEK